MLRTERDSIVLLAGELDALPMLENAGLPWYGSKLRAVEEHGADTLVVTDVAHYSAS